MDKAKTVAGVVGSALLIILIVTLAFVPAWHVRTNADTDKRHEGYCAAKGGTVAKIQGDRVCAYEDQSFIVVPPEALQ